MTKLMPNRILLLKRSNILIFVLLFSGSFFHASLHKIYGQETLIKPSKEVITLTTNSLIRDGFHVEANGDILIGSGGLQDGTIISKYKAESGLFLESYVGGMRGVIDIDQKSNGDLIATNYDDNTVSSITIKEDKKIVKTIAVNLNGPAGVAIDENDNVYISNYGAPPNYDGNEIHKINTDGQLSLLVESELLFRFQGILINGKGELIVSSSGRLFKVNKENGEIEVWLDLEGINFGHMIFRNRDSCIYGTSIENHKIYKVDPNGVLTVLAGNEAGYRNGSLDDARFTAPLGLGISPDENYLYIGESNRLRRITLPQD